jgi:hypothetical protein
MYWIITKGKKLEASEIIVTPESGKRVLGRFYNVNATQFFSRSVSHTFSTNNYYYSCCVFWLDFQKIGQPSVIGEIIAGIVLGPSLLGLYFPNFQEFVSCGILGNLKLQVRLG